MKVYWKIIAGLLVTLYPLAIFFGLNYFEPRFLAAFLFVILLLRYLSSNGLAVGGKKIKWGMLFLSSVLIISTFIYNSIDALKLYPVIVNLSLLLVFATSLYFPPTAIERFARIKEPDLPPEGVVYTRAITKIWCVFFAFNAATAFYTAVYTSLEIWTLYNGLVAYILMGVLFIGELYYRKYHLKVKA